VKFERSLKADARESGSKETPKEQADLMPDAKGKTDAQLW
jgi:hypothetical protein